ELRITVSEVTYCNSISVSEHVVLMILALVRNYIPSYQQVIEGGWNIADCVSRSYDLEGMQVGTVGAGRIGSAVLRRLQPFEVGLHYTDKHRLPAEEEERLRVTFHPTAEALVQACDVVTIHAPLHPEPDHPWRTMPHHGMTPHTSGTSLSAQARYAAGTREILECWFDGRPIREEYLIVDAGHLAGAGAHSYTA